MADTTYQPGVYRKQGGNELVVANGGKITVESGGEIEYQDGSIDDRTVSRAEVVITTNVITAAENGKVFFLDLAGGFVSTLPAPAIGLEFEFIIKTAPTGSYTIVTASSANIIKGQVYTSDVNSGTDTDFEASGGDTISFVLSKAIAGDRVVLRCDGTNWFAYCFCSVFDAITITTAS